MGVPYTRVVQVAASTEDPFVTLQAPVRGTLTRFIVSQVGGTIAGFTVELYDRRDPAAAYVSVSEAAGEAGVDSPYSHRLMAPEHMAPGEALERYDLNVPYVNQDDRDQNTQRPLPYLYLRLAPDEAGDKIYEVAFTVLMPTCA